MLWDLVCVCCLSSDFTYSDSNWNSSERESSSWRESKAEDIACRAVITMNYMLLMTQAFNEVEVIDGGDSRLLITGIRFVWEALLPKP